VVTLTLSPRLNVACDMFSATVRPRPRSAEGGSFLEKNSGRKKT
jgi:hypothetical protein